jgi:hypothetical protein
MDGFLLTATAIINQATAMAAQGAPFVTVVTATPIITGANLQPTVCPPALESNPPLDGLYLTATAMVAEATMMAQPPCIPPASAQAVPMPALNPTPISGLMNTGATTAVLTQAVSGIPAGTIVRLNGGFYNGTEWNYLISTQDGARSATVPEALLMPIASTAPTPVRSLGVIASLQWVYLRQGPDVSFSPVVSVAPGTLVQILEQNDSGDWLHVRLDNGYEGWVSASLVNFTLTSGLTSLQPTAAPPGCLPNQVMNATNHLQEIYAIASESGSAVGTFTPGTIATVLQSEVNSGAEWLLISIVVPGGSLTGWIPASAASALPCAQVEMAVATLAPAAPLCTVINPADASILVRSDPSTTALNMGVLPKDIAAQVIRQMRGSDDGRVWYLLSAQIGSANITGWVRADMVIGLDSCLPSNDATATATPIPMMSATPTAVPT